MVIIYLNGDDKKTMEKINRGIKDKLIMFLCRSIPDI